MISKVFPISELPMMGSVASRPPDLALAFVPPGPDLETRIATLSETWPEAEILGCEAATQFTDSQVVHDGCVQPIWMERPESRVSVEVLVSEDGEPVADEALNRLAAGLRRADVVFFLCDGLRFSIQDRLTRCSRNGACRRAVPGGLASQEVPPSQIGARVFYGGRPLPGACLVLALLREIAE
jgi:hypothetical protein